MPNRLADETSPYLLQHQNNPVDWYPWGPEALARARGEGRPILLSIGYSACHWCHVMERESFENDEIAAVMNQHFVCIKVDREERPDIDDIYMQATVTLNRGQGGWPMTVFLTPELEPFFAGTYYPPEDKYGRPGFKTLLEKLAEAWAEENETLVEQAKMLTARLADESRALPGLRIGEVEIQSAREQLSQQFDARYGGFSPAPKFPPSSALSFLLRVHARSGDADDLKMVTTTLDAMADGGMYDHIGGGFCRYSTDERWLVPHFEKMLYDNAQLVRVYLEAHQVTGDQRYRRVATEILDYILREMTSEEGGFYSATDADSEGVEGKFFVWTPEEINEILGAEDGDAFCVYYDIEAGGNWEGQSIPNTPRTAAQIAAQIGYDAAELEVKLPEWRARVYDAREKRVHPGLDDKILTAWNALMIGAMAHGARVLGDDRYLSAARNAAEFVASTLMPGGKLLRTYRAGKAHLQAYLEDHAYLADALVDLYEAGGDVAHLRLAESVAATLLSDYLDADSGAFFTTAKDHEQLIMRRLEGHDGAIPNANAVAARALVRLGGHTGRSELFDAGVRALQAFGKAMARAPRAYGTALCVLDYVLEGPVEVAVVGEDSQDLWAAVNARYLPNLLLARAPEGDDALPLLAGKGPVDGRAALYVCRDYACQQPITDPLDLATVLAERGSQRQRSLQTRLAGRASSEGTARYAARFAERWPHGFRTLGPSALEVSVIGFGGYRVSDESPTHREALRKALTDGCNLIDTSTNYTDGHSEQLVGEEVRDLVRAGTIARDEVTVVSKVGYVQGHNLALAHRREQEGQPFPDMVRYMDECWHCVHPAFLADQLSRSLDRLGLETLDVLLLHNPEYYFSDAQKRGRSDVEAERDIFYGRLEAAFGFMEEQVRAGKIGWYGVSSNTVTLPDSNPNATSLARMLEAARAVGGDDHHFAVLQLPMNLVESQAAIVNKGGPDGDRPVLAAAQDAGVAVLVNRPLNAIVEDGIIRLASFDVTDDAPRVSEQLDAVAELEAELVNEVSVSLQTNRGALNTASFFRWAEELRGMQAHINGLSHWQQLEAQVIRPQLAQSLRLLEQGLPADAAERWRSRRLGYLQALDRLMEAFDAFATEQSRRSVARVADPIRDRLAPGQSFSRQAMHVVASTPGVTSVLNGIRRTEYVDDALGIMGLAALEDAAAIYEVVRAP